MASSSEAHPHTTSHNRKVLFSSPRSILSHLGTHRLRQVLIIHTGGTIGMFKDQNGKF